MAGKKRKQAGTPAIQQLTIQGIAFGVVEYERGADSGSYGQEAAKALNVDPGLICKTLLVELADGELVVAVIPVTGQLNLRALARAAGTKKAVLAPALSAERKTGYVVGGISPFGQRNAHRTFVDESVEQAEEVFISGGRRGLEVVVAAEVFVDVLGAIFVPLVVS